jgi:PAS domain S-box-containing protein
VAVEHLRGRVRRAYRRSRWRSSLALSIYKNRYTRLVDSGLIGVGIGGLDGTLDQVNDAFLGMVGYTRADFRAGKLQWRKMTPPEWADGDDEAIAHLRASGITGSFEKEFLRKDGTRVPVLIGGAFLDAEGDRVIFYALDISIRKRAEAELDLERRRLLAVLAALPVGIVVLDAAGRVVESNASLQRIWGALPVMQRAEDLRVFKVHAASGPETLEARFWRVVATGEPLLEEELQIEAFDGVRRTVLGSALPIRSAEGAIAGVVGLLVDITERARAEAAMRILSETTAALIESLDPDVTLRTLSRIVVTHIADSCVIDEVDEHGELRRLVADGCGPGSAEEAARLLSYPPSGTGSSLAAGVLRSGKPVLISDFPDDWLAAEPGAGAAFETSASSVMVLPLAARGRPLGVLGIISTRRDRCYDARDLALAEEISRRASLALDNAHLHREAAAALRARDRALTEVDAFLNGSPVGFVVIDRELRIRRVNAVFARWERLAPSELVGRRLEDLASHDLRAQGMPALREAFRTGRPIVDQVLVGELLHGSGEVKHHLVSCIPLLDADGTTHGVGIVITDVTRLTEVEAALREEAVFRERFIGVLAHDLRNPLHAIIGSAATLLREEEAPLSWTRPVGRIARAAERMKRMIGNLLDLVRSREGGGIPVSRKLTDLAEVVREVVGELEAAYPGRQIAVTVEGDTRAELDADRMAEVFTNLASNALAYSPDESVVRIDVRGGAGEVVLAVHNAGEPIPPETQKTIFLPFQRGADRDREPPSMRSLGLGLFIVGEIARAHGGTIAVSSTAEAGTTFSVRLPRRSAKAAA